MKELYERIENVRTDAEYTLAQKEQETQETIRQMEFDNQKNQTDQQERWETVDWSQAFAIVYKMW